MATCSPQLAVARLIDAEIISALDERKVKTPVKEANRKANEDANRDARDERQVVKLIRRSVSETFSRQIRLPIKNDAIS